MSINVGSVSVDVVPSARQFGRDLRSQILPEASRVGDEVGKQLGNDIVDQLAKSIGEGIDQGGQQSQPESRKQGRTVGKTFADEVKRQITDALRSLPEVNLTADSSDVDRKLAEVRSELADLSTKRIGVDIDESEALAKVDRLKTELDVLTTQSPSIGIRADTTRAASKLAVLQGQVAKLDGEDATVKVDADTSRANAKLAESKNLLDSYSGRLQLILGAIVAAAPAAGAAITAGVGAGFIGLAAVAQHNNQLVKGSFLQLKDDVISQTTEMTSGMADDFAHALGSIRSEFDALAPDLRQVFANVTPDINLLTDGVDRLARNAMPGLLDITRTSQPVFQGLSDLLASTGSAVSDLFTTLSQHSAAFGATFTDLGSIVRSVVDLVGNLLAQLADFFATDGAQITQFFSELSSLISGLTSGALPVFSSALRGVLDILNGIMAIIGPIAPELGGIGAALLLASGYAKLFGTNLRGLVGELRGVATAEAAVTAANAGESISTAGAAAAGATGRLSGLASGAENLATRLGVSAERASSFGSAILSVGDALPALSVGIIAAVGSFEAMQSIVHNVTGTVDSLASGLAQGGNAAGQAAIQIGQNAQMTQWWHDKLGPLGDLINHVFIPSTDDVVQKLMQQKNVTRDVAEMMIQAGQKQALYTGAVMAWGKQSPQAQAAQQQYAVAVGKVADAQKQAAEATKTDAEQVRDDTSAKLAAIGATLSLQGSYLSVESATKSYSSAVKNSGANSLAARQAYNALQQAELAVVNAAVKKADADNVNANAAQKARAETDAQTQAILKLANDAGGKLDPALAKMVQSLDQTTLKSYESTAGVKGLHTAVITLPNGKTIKIGVDDQGVPQKLGGLGDKLKAVEGDHVIQIKAPTQAVQDELTTLGFHIVHLPHGQVVIVANTNPLYGALQLGLAHIDKATGTITTNNNITPAEQRLANLIADGNGSVAWSKLNADDAGGRRTLAQLIHDIYAAGGNVTIGGNRIPADLTTSQLVDWINTHPPGVLHINGNPGGANRATDGATAHANAQHPQIKVGANTDAANNSANAFFKAWNGKKVYFQGIFTTGANPNPGQHGGLGHGSFGGLVTSGGDIVHAAGGTVIPGYAPGQDIVPSLLSPGEAVLVPELVRAIGAKAILAANAAASAGRRYSFGGIVQRFATGGVATAPATGGTAPAASGTTDPTAATALPTAADLQAATQAATALNTALGLLNTTYTTLNATMQALHTTVTTLLEPALLVLHTDITTLVVPDLQLLQVQSGILGNDFTALQSRTAVAWAGITNSIIASQNAISARQGGLQAQMGASWAAITASVWASVHSSNGALRALEGGLGGVRGAIGATQGFAASQFAAIYRDAAGPIRQTITGPFDAGLIAAWNSLSDQFGLNKHISRVPVGFATGGLLQGPGTATSDSIPLLGSNGEFIVNAASTAKYLPLLQAINAPRYADGGLVGSLSSIVDPAFNRMPSLIDALLAAYSGNLGAIDGAGISRIGEKDAKKAFGDQLQELLQRYASMGGAGVQRWAPLVLEALAIEHQPASLLGTVLRRMQQESGGNPTIVNTTDSNWAAGHPSVGLMQVIGPTYRSNVPPAFDVGPYLFGTSVNPLSNLLASMQYAIGTYGSLSAAYNRAGGYDFGGLANGKGVLLKNTVEPERVLSPQQTRSFDRLVSLLESGNPEQLGGGMTNYFDISEQSSSQSTAHEVVRQLTFSMR